MHFFALYYIVIDKSVEYSVYLEYSVSVIVHQRQSSQLKVGLRDKWFNDKSQELLKHSKVQGLYQKTAAWQPLGHMITPPFSLSSRNKNVL